MSDAILAVDQGTTGTTALVVSREGAVLSRAYGEIPQHYPEPGWVEQEPEDLWRVSLGAMEEALTGARLGPGELRGIGITNQRETTILWDAKTGRSVHPAVVWQSRQTAALCEALKGAGHEPLIRERTGLVVDAYFSGTKIRWILDRHPEVRRRAEDGGVLFGTVDSWLIWKLTGGRVHATDPTNASRTMLYDIRAQRWDETLLSILGVPPALLPVVRPSAGPFGETTAVGSLPAGVPITGVAGDQQAALYGQGCWDAGFAKNTYGTGCFLMMNMGPSSPASPGGLLTTLACDARGAPAYALEGSVFAAGAAIQWLRDELGVITSASQTEALARSVPNALGVYMVPAFAGLGAPHWDMSARGAILGLTRGASRAHVVRATLESLAYQTRDVVDVMNRDSGITIRELRADGGAAANDFLMQFQADILGVPVVRPAMLETTALGAARLAGIGAGVWQAGRDFVQGGPGHTRFEPRISEGEKECLYAGWKDAVDRVKTRG